MPLEWQNLSVYTLFMKANRHAEPADAARDCACFNLRKAARAVTQLYESALAPSGIHATQFSVMVALALVEGAPLSRVADGLVMDRTTLTRNLRPLQRRGWVRIEAGEDRRERNLSLTRSGRAALERALPLWQQAQARLHERLGDAHWARLLQDLPRVVAVAQEATTTGDQR
jgi:DNA-binding MarR family transcriptional regulator